MNETQESSDIFTNSNVSLISWKVIDPDTLVTVEYLDLPSHLSQYASQVINHLNGWFAEGWLDNKHGVALDSKDGKRCIVDEKGSVIIYLEKA